MSDRVDNDILVEDDEIDLKELFNTLKRYKWSIIFITLLTTIGASVYVKTKPNIYKTNASIEINEKKASLGGASALMAMAFGGSISSGSGSDVALIKSRYILDSVLDYVDIRRKIIGFNSIIDKKEYYANYPIKIYIIKQNPNLISSSFKIKIQNNDSFDLKLKVNSATDSKEKEFKNYKFNELITTDDITFKVIKVKPKLEFKNYQIDIASKEYTIEQLTKNNKIDVEFDKKNSSILNLSYEDTIPQRAKDFLNELIKTYLQEKVKRKTDEYVLVFKSIDSQLKIVKKQLQDAEEKMKEFQETKKTIDITSETVEIAKTLAEFDNKLMLLNMKINIVKKLLNSVKNGKNLETLTIAGTGLEDPNIAKLISQLQSAMLKKRALLKEFTPAYPEIQKLSSQIVQLKQMIFKSLNNTLKVLTTTKSVLVNSMQKYQSKIKNLPKKQFSFINIKRKLEFNEKYYAYLLKKKSELELQQLMAISKNRVLDEPYTLLEPIKPKRKLIIIVAFITGLILSIFIAFFRAFLNSKITSIKELEREAAAPILAAIAHTSKKDLKELAIFKESKFSESFRRLRSNLREYLQNNSNIIAINSTANKEGKSIVSANLAGVISLISKKVLIIDTNLRDSTLHNIFSIENTKGISTLLENKDDLDKVIKKTKYKNIDIIPAGPKPNNPSELLESDKFKNLLADLKNSYDVIILDTPSITAAPESKAILDYSDIILYIFRENYSKIDYIKNANRLKQEYTKPFYIVYNDTKDKEALNYY